VVVVPGERFAECQPCCRDANVGDFCVHEWAQLLALFLPIESGARLILPLYRIDCFREVVESNLVTMATTAASMGVTQAFALFVSQPIYWDPQHAIDVWSRLDHIEVT